MKNGINLRELQEKLKEDIALTPCLVCGKRIKDGFYGRWYTEEHVNSGTCSKKCEGERRALFQVQGKHQAE